MMQKLMLILAASALPFQAIAQTVPQVDDTPEEIAKDASRDLKDNRFYNKPGATRADYDRDWQECRLIARGSRTPAGTITYYDPSLYNPAISPMAGAIGGGIGAAIGAAIIEGQQRRANRRACLLIRGWRLVELPADETARVAALADADKDAYFNRIVGAADVMGDITSVTSFERKTETPVPAAGPAQFFAGKKVDPKAPVTISEEEAAVVVAFRRSAETANQHGIMSFKRFDADKGDLIFQPRDWKKKGDKTVYAADVTSADKTSLYELQIVRLTPGSYVIDFDGLGKMNLGTTYCFGAPMFTVKAGEIAYLTDILPVNMKKPDGKRVIEVGLVRDATAARAGLATFQPALAERLSEAQLKNRATFSCFGTSMTRSDYPGVADVWTASPAKAEGDATNAAVPAAAKDEPTPAPAPAIQ
jgi:hypothetical protein